MKKLSNMQQTELEATLHKKMTEDIFLYAAWPGIAYDLQTTSLKVPGDATGFFSAGDIIALPRLLKISTEVEIYSVTFYTDHTVIIFPRIDYGDEPDNLMVYLRKRITDQLESVEKVSFKLEGEVLNTFHSGQGGVIISDPAGTWCGTDGFLPSRVVTDTLDSVTTTQVVCAAFTGYDLRGHTIQIITAGGADKSFFILAQSGSTLTLDGDAEDAGCSAGDTFFIKIQREGLLSIHTRMKGISGSILSFAGMVTEADRDPVKRLSTISANGFLKRLDNTPAYETCTDTQLHENPFLQLIDYESSLDSTPGVKRLQVKFPDKNPIKGLSIRTISLGVNPGYHRLWFIHPDKLKLDSGSPVQFDIEEDSQDVAIGGLALQLSGTQYTGSDQLVIIWIPESRDPQDTKIGCVTAQFDGGSRLPVHPAFTRMFHTQADGELTALEGSSVLFSGVADQVLYLESTEKYSRIRVVGPSTPAILSGTWQFSRGYGSSGWVNATVESDTTNGFSQGGVITFQEEPTWSKKSKIFSDDSAGLYCMRLQLSGSAQKSVALIQPIATLPGKVKDKLSVGLDFHKLSEPGDDDVIIKEDDSVATWSQSVLLEDAVTQLLGDWGRKAVASFECQSTNSIVNEIPRPAGEPKELTIIRIVDEYLYAGFGPRLWRLQNAGNWEQVLQLGDEEYVIKGLRISGSDLEVAAQKQDNLESPTFGTYWCITKRAEVQNADQAEFTVVLNDQTVLMFDPAIHWRSGRSQVSEVGGAWTYSNSVGRKAYGVPNNSENWIIPFEQRVQSILYNQVYHTVEPINLDDLDADAEDSTVKRIDQDRTSIWQVNDSADNTYDIAFPTLLIPGFYFVWIMVGTQNGYNVAGANANIRYSLGQRTTLIDGPDGFMGTGYYDGHLNPVLCEVLPSQTDAEALFQVPQANDTYLWRRTFMNDSVHWQDGGESRYLIASQHYNEYLDDSYVHLPCSLDDFLPATGHASEAVWIHDTSVYNDRTSLLNTGSASLTLQDGYEIFIWADRRFGYLILEVDDDPSGWTWRYSDGAGGWITFEPTVTSRGGGIYVVDWGAEPDWVRDDNANISATDKFLIKTAYKWSSNTIDSLRTGKYQVWCSDYSAAENLYTILEMELFPGEDLVFGCVIDKETMEYSLFEYDIAAGTMTYSTSGLVSGMQPAHFVYHDSKIWCIEEARRADSLPALITIESDFTVTRLIEFDASFTCNTRLTASDTWGVVGVRDGEIWQYTDTYRIRLDVVKFGTNTIRQALSKLLELQGMTLRVTDESTLQIDKRTEPSPDSWTIPENQELQESKPDGNMSHAVDGVAVSWDDGSSRGEVRVGKTGKGARVMRIRNQYIRNSLLARTVAVTVFIQLAAPPRTRTFLGQFQPHLEIRDGVIHTDGDTFEIRGITHNIKERQTELELVEST